ncbi:transcription elongation factor A N-terminal and central domain-containing protein 2 isoform X1 [Ailuropoda melanoleuca]|uniref:transcription elongation factor A N-terminal and central domain-containing protein 2 isoform X1 n=1 Tax=Ailuropoda melanoleuca TaxID=9646 RepID=UPI0014942E2E|nr:transcription elongation factor A N-terminal and central domain-containing protein 2 isoform X1 [Ailuropoda melanoleuca]
MWGSIPECRDHALSQRQTLNDCATEAPPISMIFEMRKHVKVKEQNRAWYTGDRSSADPGRFGHYSLLFPPPPSCELWGRDWVSSVPVSPAQRLGQRRSSVHTHEGGRRPGEVWRPSSALEVTMQDGVQPALDPEFPMVLQFVLCQCVCLHARGPWCPHAGAGSLRKHSGLDGFRARRCVACGRFLSEASSPRGQGGQDLSSAHKGKCIEHYPGGLGPGLELIKCQDFSKFIFWSGRVVENRITTAQPPHRALPRVPETGRYSVRHLLLSPLPPKCDLHPHSPHRSARASDLVSSGAPLSLL